MSPTGKWDQRRWGSYCTPGTEGGSARILGAKRTCAPSGEGSSDRVAEDGHAPLGTRVPSSEIRAGPFSWDSLGSGAEVSSGQRRAGQVSRTLKVYDREK